MNHPWKTTLVLDAPLSSIWVTTLIVGVLRPPIRFLGGLFWPGVSRLTVIDNDSDWYILKDEGIVKVKNSLYLFRTG